MIRLAADCLRSARLLLVVLPALAAASPGSDWTAALVRGIELREKGDLRQAIDILAKIRREASTDEAQAKAAGELGIALLLAHRHDEALAPLTAAHGSSSGAERARYAVHLGNLAILRKRPDEARARYQEALSLSPTDADTNLSAGLNLARLAAPGERLGQLQALGRRLGDLPGNEFARHHINLGNQARQLGSPGLELAYRHLERGRRMAATNGDKRLAIEASDALAQLYEDQQREREALSLTRQGFELAAAQPPGLIADLLINLEWRQARLLRRLEEPAAALASYQRAMAQIDAVRQDIPIEYEDGASSFRTMLEPVYLGYLDLLLQQVDRQAPELRAAQLHQAVQAIESIRQAELQDFLGDRCSVEAVQGGGSGDTPAGTAVLYPLVLPDRIELLLRTGTGITRRTTPVGGDALRKAATSLAYSLRNGLYDFKAPARQLHDWLLRPFADVLIAGEIRSLVVVPDGALRLVPMAALHDGERFAVERHAISVVTGMTMTNTAAPGREVASLVVGMSEPGPVAEKLAESALARVFGAAEPGPAATRGLAATRALRSVRVRSTSTATAANDAKRGVDKLREALALPGVKHEVESLGRVLGGTTMLDADFTVGGFSKEAEAGDYRIVHIASHGVFGGSADSSFIMAYDDVLTLDGLQNLLKSDKFRRQPIELLSLSACETAEGNERSPLGISGAAIKARAKSVLGTLWPVDDNAAKRLMESFYGELAAARSSSKAEALRHAQMELMRGEFSHPFFWAPFVLIGNWL